MTPLNCIESNYGIGSALIMIPDISGFTNYISHADLQHSQVSIASLLEAILDSNKLGLTVSEIEGDAILFYNFNDDSTFDEIIEQCELMFDRFHEKLIELKDDGCKCGSCQKMQNLGLKFVLHFGELGSLMVKNYCKLYGRDLIIAHRLLKNDLRSSEYILFTQEFSSRYEKSDRVNWQERGIEGNAKIEDIGTVGYNYFDLRSKASSKKIVV